LKTKNNGKIEGKKKEKKGKVGQKNPKNLLILK